MDIHKHQIIESFVRGSLGCHCPDKVFENITATVHPQDFKDVLGETFFTRSQSFDIGGILLVLVVEVKSINDLILTMPVILQRGIEVRDQKGFNRFRFVVANSEPQAERLLQQKFKNMSNGDEKVHLHIISSDNVPKL